MQPTGRGASSLPINELNHPKCGSQPKMLCLFIRNCLSSLPASQVVIFSFSQLTKSLPIWKCLPIYPINSTVQLYCTNTIFWWSQRQLLPNGSTPVLRTKDSLCRPDQLWHCRCHCSSLSPPTRPVKCTPNCTLTIDFAVSLLSEAFGPMARYALLPNVHCSLVSLCREQRNFVHQQSRLSLANSVPAITSHWMNELNESLLAWLYSTQMLWRRPLWQCPHVLDRLRQSSWPVFTDWALQQQSEYLCQLRIHLRCSLVKLVDVSHGQICSKSSSPFPVWVLLPDQVTWCPLV